MAEACHVVNVLEPKVKKDLLTWFVKLQLSEYLVLFADDQEVKLQSYSILCMTHVAAIEEKLS